MKLDFQMRRNVYIILSAIIILASIIEITRSQYVLQFSKNIQLAEERILPSVVSIAPTEHDDQPAYCVYAASNDEYSGRVHDNVVRMLEYMKKRTILLDHGQMADTSCRVAIITGHQLDEIEYINELVAFVENGGYLMFANALDQDYSFYRHYRKLGIHTVGNMYSAYGIRLVENVLIGEGGLELDHPYVFNAVNRIALDSDTEILAETLDGNPLLWRREYGQGAFMVFNGTMLQEKLNRGMFTGALSLLEPDYIYPIFNTKQVYIDDFPAPIGEQVISSIQDIYHKDLARFYRENWWPDMLSIAKRTGVKYTAGVIQTYNDQVHPPFESPIGEQRENLLTFGREVIKSGGEIAIHGYNHQSLHTDPSISSAYGYNSWPSREVMTQSVEEAIRYIHSVFPNYTLLNYIPPSNVLSEEGREALKQAWPSLMSIASLYQEDATGRTYTQEFAVAEDRLIEMPRLTSGYLDTPFVYWVQANGVTSHGVFSHFVHPDDVIDEERSYGLTWEELYDGFEHMLLRVNKSYPWLRDMTATEGAIALEKSLSSTVRLEREDKRIRGIITPFHGEMQFVLRTKQRITGTDHCDAQKIDTNTYLIIAHQAQFTITLSGASV